jgi:hypothetical protein
MSARLTQVVWSLALMMLIKNFGRNRSTRGRLGTTREDFKTTQGSAGVPSNLGMIQAFLRTFGLWDSGTLKDYSPRPSRLLENILLDYKVLGACRMDIPGPTTQVGTGTNYSVSPWDYSTCATRHLLA